MQTVWGADRLERTLSVSAQPASVILGGSGPETVEVAVRVDGPAVASVTIADLRLHATAGRISELRAVSDGVFRATLEPPRKRFPRYVAVTAMLLRAGPVREHSPPVVASTIVAYGARIELPGRSEPKAQVWASVGGQRFGPVRAARDGRFALPIDVPPGEGWARVVSVDRLGNRSTSRVNLYLPKVRKLHTLVHPRRVLADGEDLAWVFVHTLSSRGAPRSRPVRLEAERGRLGEPQSVAAGLQRVSYKPPERVGDGRVLLRVSEPRDVGQGAKTRLRVLPAAPVAVKLQRPERTPVAARQTPWPLHVRVLDGHGNPVGGQWVQAESARGAFRAAPRARGYRINVPPPQRAGEETFQLRARARSPDCARPRLAKTSTGMHVVDVRGLPCQGDFEIHDATGKRLAAGELGPQGALPAASARWQKQAGAYLTIRPHATNAPTARVSLSTHSETPTLARATLRKDVVVRWQVPLPGAPRLRVLSGADGRWVLEARHAGSGQLRLEAGRARVRVLGARAGGVQFVVQRYGDGLTQMPGSLGARSGCSLVGGPATAIQRGGQPVCACLGAQSSASREGPPVDVVATEKRNGVSTWRTLR